jgi:hypothetical protein
VCDSSELKEFKEKLVDGCHILDREGITAPGSAM